MTTEFNYRDPNSRLHIWCARQGRALIFDSLRLSWALSDWRDVDEKLKRHFMDIMKSNNDSLQKSDPEKTPGALQQDNENILRFIESEQRNLRHLKFYLYEHSPYPDAREMLEGDVDFFIMEYLDTDTEKDLRLHFQDLLFLALLGGEPTEDGLYKFHPWDEIFPPPAQQGEMAYLIRLGMIETCTKPTDYGDNLTHTGTAVLKRLNELLGPSTAASCYKAYIDKMNVAAPSI
ncbi:MAG: hypothetical protein WBK55_06590 [Alphaproteobacteria bacterium]